MLSIQEKIELIKGVGEEIVGIDEIKEKLEKLEKGEIKEIRAYDGLIRKPFQKRFSSFPKIVCQNFENKFQNFGILFRGVKC